MADRNSNEQQLDAANVNNANSKFDLQQQLTNLVDISVLQNMAYNNFVFVLFQNF